MKKFEFKLTVFEGDDPFWKMNPTPEYIHQILDDCLKTYGFKNDLTLFELTGYKDIPAKRSWD